MYTNKALDRRPTAAGVLVWGEVLWDRFPDGDELGGAPANVAWHLAGLGAPVALVSRVGDDDAGRRACDRLAARGVDVTLVQRDAAHATGEVTVTVAAGEPRYRLVPDRAWEHLAFTDAVAAALPGARAIVYGTLAQRRPAGRAALAAAHAAASPRVLRVCDPNLRPAPPSADDDRALAEALAAADVVKLNEREVGAIAARLGHADPIAWLLGRGARLVAVTRGAAGSTWYAPAGQPFTFAPDAAHGTASLGSPSGTASPTVLEVAAVAARPGGDNVGCGDAFVAALVHGLVAGWPWARIGRVASALAAEVAGARGATPATDGAALAAALGAEAA